MNEAKDALNRLTAFTAGELIGASEWITIDQTMIDQFGALTLDPDPMHLDPKYAARNGRFGGTIAYGFLTLSLLTHMMHDAQRRAGLAGGDQAEGQYLNYGFDRLRFVAPVKAGARVRGIFRLLRSEHDEKGQLRAAFDCKVEIEGEERPAIVAEWLSAWVPARPQ